MSMDLAGLHRLAFERSPFGIAVTRGHDHEVIAVNALLLGALEQAEPAVLGRPLTRHVPELKGALDAALEERRPTPAPVVTERTSIRSALRALRWTVDRSASERRAEGMLLVHACDVSEEVARRRRDATESRRLRRVTVSVERHAAELDALLENMTEGVLVADARGKVVLVNRVAREVLGAPLAAVSDLRRFDVRRTDGTPLPYDELPLVRALRGERFAGVEVVHVHEGGAQRRLVCAGCAASAPGGDPLVMVVLHDVSELRRVEAERDEALALISHDLRTPLSTIAMRSEWMRKALLERGEVELARTAELVVRGARRIAAMTDELGVASAIKRLDLAPVSLVSLVVDAVEQAVPPAERARVRVEPCGDLPPVSADAERLERAVGNLASNAVKYSPADAPIVIRLARGRGEVVLTVEDGGVGIPPEDLPHLFQKTFRARTAGAVEGLGLGLYIVRLIVEAHGGRVWVESQVGRGSRFHVALPITTSP